VLAQPSLFIRSTMTRFRLKEPHCSYVAIIARPCDRDELTELAHYLSDLGVTGCEVVILDETRGETFAAQRDSLRWVGRHETPRPQHRSAFGGVDRLRAAADLAGTEKVIVAAHDVRFDLVALERTLSELDIHEAVEPQEFCDPLPWWEGLDASRMLMRRGVEPEPNHSATFAFRRSVIASVRSLAPSRGGDDTGRLTYAGVDVMPALDAFVHRPPATLSDWIAARPGRAAAIFDSGAKAGFFLTFLPLLMIAGVFGGAAFAATAFATVAFASIAVALRGRRGAEHAVPLYAALLAPLWIVERSVLVYVALYSRFAGAAAATEPASAGTDGSRSRAASGE
jgi:hypothetical protein